MLLKKYIRKVINENFNYLTLKTVVDELNKISIDIANQESNDKSYTSLTLNDDLGDCAENYFGMSVIGDGVFKKVYAMQEKNWVLKIGTDTPYCPSIQEEIDVSQGKHGLGVRDMFTKVYAWDKVNPNPQWLITDRVITLETAYKHLTVEQASQIFPTIYNAIDSVTSRYKTNARNFLDVVAEFLFDLGMTGFNSNYNGLSKREFYDLLDGASPANLKPFKNVQFYNDYRRIARAFAHKRPIDLHNGNIGIVPPSEGVSSPDDIVILDYSFEDS